MTLKKQGTFNDDHDFFEIGNSPSRFLSSDDEESPNPKKIEIISDPIDYESNLKKNKHKILNPNKVSAKNNSITRTERV